MLQITTSPPSFLALVSNWIMVLSPLLFMYFRSARLIAIFVCPAATNSFIFFNRSIAWFFSINSPSKERVIQLGFSDIEKLNSMLLLFIQIKSYGLNNVRTYLFLLN